VREVRGQRHHLDLLVNVRSKVRMKGKTGLVSCVGGVRTTPSSGPACECEIKSAYEGQDRLGVLCGRCEDKGIIWTCNSFDLRRLEKNNCSGPFIKGWTG